METCVCYLPTGPCHCRRCHTNFADRHEAMNHLTDRRCKVAECTTCATPWWLSHVPGAPVPQAGTWCICVGCGDAAIFTGRGLEVREPTPGESDRIGQDVFILEYREHRELTRRTG
jgi:hypothetical protein